MRVYGVNPVLEALKVRRVESIRVVPRHDGRLESILRIAREQGIRVTTVEASDLDRLLGRGHHVHQGVVADVRAIEPVGLGELIELLPASADQPLVVVLDGIEDPHNVGAILRSVDAAGADGVVRQTRRAAPLDGAAGKASAGAVAHVKVADVVNIARALETLKDKGIWAVGLDASATMRYDEVDLTLPTALVVGAEGHGLRRLVRERCDWLVSIPMAGHVQSLNVSVATAIALFEAVRQRRHSGRGSRHSKESKP